MHIKILNTDVPLSSLAENYLARFKPASQTVLLLLHKELGSYQCSLQQARILVLLRWGTLLLLLLCSQSESQREQAQATVGVGQRHVIYVTFCAMRKPEKNSCS